MHKLNYRIAGDRGVLVTFGQEINEQTLQRVLSFEKKLNESDLPHVNEIIRGYCTLYVEYDPLKLKYETLIDQLKKIEQEASGEKILFPSSKSIEIPGLYGGEYGPDLPLVAEFLGISEEEVIQRHLASDYLVYVAFFIGGSAHFKGNDRLFEIPRKKDPVTFYPAGSILIAAGLGIVFKATSGPTGWNSIGICPLRQWYPDKDPPVLIKTGDRIRYKRINEDEFRKIKREVDNNTYKLKYL